MRALDEEITTFLLYGPMLAILVVEANRKLNPSFLDKIRVGFMTSMAIVIPKCYDSTLKASR